MRPKAIIFDFDGTLADSYEAITASVNHVRAFHGLARLRESEVRRHVGHGPSYLMEHTVGGPNVEEDLARYRAHHPSVLRGGTRLLPGVADTLRALHAAHMKLAVCSNKPRPFTETLLDYLNLAPFFAAVVGPEDAPRIKPSPDMLLLALDRLSVPAPEALYVGDMVVDIQTARQAGVPVWVIPTGSDDRASLAAGKPDRLLDSFNDLLDLLTPDP
jgi:2-phosphoglycolate phosphatase